jgi:hypothetical protein
LAVPAAWSCDGARGLASSVVAAHGAALLGLHAHRRADDPLNQQQHFSHVHQAREEHVAQPRCV